MGGFSSGANSNWTIAGDVGRMVGWLVIALVLALPAGAEKLVNVIPGLYGGDGITLDNDSHRAHFEEEGASGLTAELDQINSEILNAINLVNSGAAVASFTFDIQEAIFVQSTESLGPTVAERPQTIGEGKINFGFSYTRREFKKFDGDDLNDIEIKLKHVNCDEDVPFDPGDPMNTPVFDCEDPETPFGDPDFENEQVRVDLDIDLEQDLLQLFANYGITNRWDVGVTVPIVHSRIKATAKGKVANRQEGVPEFLHQFCDPDADDCVENADFAKDSRKASAWGIGDVVARSKYHIMDAGTFADWTPDVGAFGFVKFNSGDEDDFLGTGHIDFALFAAIAKTLWRITPHANAGFDISTGPSELDSFRFIGGADALLHKRVTASVDVLGRIALDKDGFGDEIYDIALGAKVNPWSTLSVLGNVILPLNENQGLRTKVTWTVGFEYTF